MSDTDTFCEGQPLGRPTLSELIKHAKRMESERDEALDALRELLSEDSARQMVAAMGRPVEWTKPMKKANSTS